MKDWSLPREAGSIMDALAWLKNNGASFSRLIELSKRHVATLPPAVRADWWDRVWHANVKAGRRDFAAVALEAACCDLAK